MTYARDTEHIEKAFIFGGMPARNGVTAATMIQAGFTGVWDVLSGDNNFFLAFTDSTRPANPELLVAELGSRFEVMLTNMKKYCVGFPIQSAMEALLLTVAEHGYKAADVEAIETRIHKKWRPHGQRPRDAGHQPAILLRGGAARRRRQLRGRARRRAPDRGQAVMDLRRRVTLIGDESLRRGQLPGECRGHPQRRQEGRQARSELPRQGR
jgi:2-methylcitrate dehydratase PrpD